MAKIDRLVGTKIANRYCITGEIGEGGMGKVFRAMPFDDPSQDVAIKVILRNTKLNAEDLLRFQKEAALMSRLHHPNIICFHELGLLDNTADRGLGSGYYIVMEIANGRDLKESLAIDGKKDLAFFFQVGLQVTAALDYTHGKNIIHRDIKPQNIVVGKAFREQKGVLVKVLDFGVARLNEVMQFTAGEGEKEGAAAGDIAGTPMYMAPEQTPYLDAPIDHRVDLYSLGCVLYEILAGRPPFQGGTRDRLMHQHVHETPEPLCSIRPEIPPIVEQIVHKLLAKHPSQRYQSAFGLYADLQRARAKLQAHTRRSVVSFPLGLNDQFKAVSARLDLVGRQKEFDLLVEGFNDIMKEKGRSRLTVIKGVPGSGKTRFLAEFRSLLAKRKIRFISTSFSRHENSLPFNALANGFNEYLSRVYKGQPHEAEELRMKVRNILGPDAMLVASVVPGLKPFIDLDTEKKFETLRRGNDNGGDEQGENADFKNFAKAFSDFTRCLSSENQPVVFIFDDMHWADDASIQLIDQFFSHNNAQRFFMVVSHRNLAQNESPVFHSFIEKFSRLRRRFEEIALAGFSQEAVGQLTGNMLNSPESASPELVNYLFTKTQGNPMYLVELLRSLVAQEYISFDATAKRWMYDLEEIKNASLSLDSVDLVLSRIQSYQESDRAVLEIAAAIGMSFPFALLLVDGDEQSMRTMKVLQRTIDDGLITRTVDDEEMKHLGKSFAFTHSRVREAIYDSISATDRLMLHRKIALRLEQLVPSPTSKTIFSIAHHINQAFGKEENLPLDLAEKGIKHNMAAGRAAYQANAWQSSQRYYEIAESLLRGLPKTDERIRAGWQVLESLADIAAKQKQNSQAVKMYHSLMAAGIDRQTYAGAAYKAATLLLVSGQVSSAKTEISKALQAIGLPQPQETATSTSLLWMSLMLDIQPTGGDSGRLAQIVKAAYKQGRKAPAATDDRAFAGARLYQLAQQIYLKERPILGLMYHQAALKECLEGRALPETMLRAVVDRAMLIAYYGFDKKAYALIDLAFEVAVSLNLKNAVGYIQLQRALTLDYFKVKFDEIDSSINQAIEALSPDADRMHHATGVIYQAYAELLRCNTPAVAQLSVQMPALLPTRNWLSPKAMFISLFGLLLEDARDILVRQGELYLKRREMVGGRPNELYVLLIKTIVTFAKGEADRSRKFYHMVASEFIKGVKAEFIYPFEEDLLAFFIVAFPDLFEQEYRRRLIKGDEAYAFFRSLEKRLKEVRGKDRAVQAVAMARLQDRLGAPDVKRLYDHAIGQARIDGNQLAQLFAFLWFGVHLVNEGVKKRQDYLLRVQKEAMSYNLGMLVDLAEKIMRERGIVFQSVRRGKDESKEEVTSEEKMAPLVYEHLVHMCETLHTDNSLAESVAESVGFFKRHYEYARIYVILTTQGEDHPEFVYPQERSDRDARVMDFISLYLNIRSTLFLPLAEAASTRDKDAAGAEPAADKSIYRTFVSRSSAFDDTEKTMAADYGHVVSEHPAEEDDGQGTVILSSGSASSSASKSAHKPVRSMASRHSIFDDLGDFAIGEDQSYLVTNTIVPIRGDGRNLGVIFVEQMKMKDGDNKLHRYELDQFGGQMGLLIQRKLDDTLARSRKSHVTGNDQSLQYETGKYHLEHVPWMDLWSHGTLRKGRESTWYLGLRLGDADYLLMYCRLNGADYIRDKLSAHLWHHMVVQRCLAAVSAHTNLTVESVYEEITKLLKADKNALQLESISIAFTLFNGEKKTAASGHFGPSRPYVIGAENEVTPHNNSILDLTSGRALRYWEVRAPMSLQNIFVMAHDSSKLDAITLEAVHKSVSLETVGGRAQNLIRLMQQTLLPENMPRYFVACMLMKESDDVDKTSSVA